nr:MAG TPA: hypothetical protein [Caudoviricetes sp.]
MILVTFKNCFLLTISHFQENLLKYIVLTAKTQIVYTIKYFAYQFIITL